jgi:diguanylate cyclase (GGDEF)-like protein
MDHAQEREKAFDIIFRSVKDAAERDYLASYISRLERARDKDRVLDIISRNINDTAEKESLVSYISRVEDSDERSARAVRKTKIDFDTIIEAVSQINANSLDLETIENFILNAVMGQFGVLKLFLMRRGDHSGRKIVPVASKNLEVPSIEFDADSEFGRTLAENAHPFEVSNPPTRIADFPEFGKIRECGIELCVPLVKSGIENEPDIKGLLCLGKKFDRMGFSQQDIDLLALLGGMVAISLHNAQLYHRSIFDEMTQVFSRGYFDMQLSQELERASRYRRGEDEDETVIIPNISLVMFDIDDFKKINDTYGHQIGDEILRSIARVVKNKMRAADIVARYGGEEFCVILPETGKEDAIKAAERMRRAIEDNQIMTERVRLKVTVSLGVSTYPEDAVDMHSLIREADKALYAAKAAGKNRAVACGQGRKSQVR